MPRSRNRLLASLSADDFGLLEPNLKAVSPLDCGRALKSPTSELTPFTKAQNGGLVLQELRGAPRRQ